MQGDITNVAVIDPAPLGQLGNLVLDPDRDFTLEITWRVFGVLAPLWLAPLGQNWADCLEYTVTVTVSAGTLPEDDGGDVSGAYKLVVSVFLNSAIGPYDVTGIREGPIIRMENPN
jgi:hypothetical protein